MESFVATEAGITVSVTSVSEVLLEATVVATSDLAVAFAPSPPPESSSSSSGPPLVPIIAAAGILVVALVVGLLIARRRRPPPGRSTVLTGSKTENLVTSGNELMNVRA